MARTWRSFLLRGLRHGEDLGGRCHSVDGGAARIWVGVFTLRIVARRGRGGRRYSEDYSTARTWADLLILRIAAWLAPGRILSYRLQQAGQQRRAGAPGERVHAPQCRTDRSRKGVFTLWVVARLGPGRVSLPCGLRRVYSRAPRTWVGILPLRAAARRGPGRLCLLRRPHRD